MNAKEKRRFIHELVTGVERFVLDKVPEMPEEWDGHELRRYLADTFEDATITMRRKRGPCLDPRYRKRLRDFDNEVATRPL